jgi:rhodanese-related sulfurtransferase
MFPPVDELEIQVSDLAALRASGETFRLVDCREQDEWDLCHIEGAELAPLSNFVNEVARRYQDKTERLIVYCHHGMRSGQAAHFLRQRGLPQVWSLAGGIEAWAVEIDPTMARY